MSSVMSSSDLVAETTGEPLPEALSEAGVYPTFAAGFDHGLVVLALGRPFWLVPSESGHQLLVEPSVLAVAREQLAKYDCESLDWPPKPVEENLPSRPGELLTPLLWSATLLAIFRGQLNGSGWADAGAMDAEALFRHGEWWRPFTALFLHADAGHALSNALSGLFIFAGVLTTFGRGRGWLLLALAAILGNLSVAAINFPGPYHSLGASTAIFAGVGLLAGRAIRIAARSDHPHRWRAMFVPLAAGLTVLGLYGAGGLQIDVGAHATGFTAGLALGFLAPPPPPAHPSPVDARLSSNR